MRFAHDTTPRKSLQRAVHSVVENLESRQLLASVSAGEIAFIDGADGPVRIAITGSGNLDFIGATLNVQGRPQLNDIPMSVFDEQGNLIREILGGYGGRDGVAPITEVTGAITGDNGVMTGIDAPYDNLPSDQVTIGGLATNVRGRTYGVNVRQQGPNNSITEILGVNNEDGTTTVYEDVSAKMLTALQAVNPAFEAGDIDDVIGADFDPNDENTLYFAVNTDYPFVDGTTTTRKTVPAMFLYNVRTKVLTLDPAFFGVSSDDDDYRIDDFTFADDGTIYLFGSIQRGANGPERVGLFSADKNDVVPTFEGGVTLGLPPDEEDVEQIAAMEFIPGQNYIVFVDAQNDNARLLGLDLNNQQLRATDLGSAIDPDDNRQTDKRGSSIGDLSFNSRLTDQQFSIGKRGVLLGTETNLDELLGIDAREKFQTPSLYAIYGDNVDTDTAVSISAITPNPDQRLSLERRLFTGEVNPYSGNAGNIQTFMPSLQTLNLDNGSLYLGIRTADQSDALTVPVLGLDPTTDLAGARPGVTFPKIVRPGVYIKGSIDDFLFGGTISGSVNIDGSVDTFYAGNVITGDPQSGSENQQDNFFVSGDIRNLLVRGGLGTLEGAPDEFSPGTDFLIGGRVQQMKTGSNFRGGIDIAGKSSERTIGTDINELEVTVDSQVPNPTGAAFGNHDGYLNGLGYSIGLTSDAVGFAVLDGITENDTFGTAEVLGSYYSKARKAGGQVTVAGNLNNGTRYNDTIDYYAVPMLAGQTIQTGVISELGTGLPIYMSVIDPDGRTYATTLSNQNQANFLENRLSVTADKPGLWRISVQVFPNPIAALYRPYVLTVDKLNELSLGGLVSDGNVSFDRLDMGLRVRSNDLGAILAAGRVEGADAVDSVSSREPILYSPIEASSGNIRSIEGSGIGSVVNNVYGLFPNIIAPKGSIGLIRGQQYVYFNQLPNSFTGRGASALTIGGDYQVVETPGDFSAYMSAKKSIGVIRVGSFANPTIMNPGYLQIDADNSGNDGTLGLLDCVGDLGNNTNGGPAISGGTGSNVRYIRVGGIAFRDRYFGSGTTVVSTARDKAVTIRDDSGANVTIRPYAGTQTTTTETAGSGGNNNGGQTGTGQVTVPDPFGGNGNPGSTGSNGIPDPFGGNGDPTNTGTNIPNPIGGTTTDEVTISDVIVGDLKITSYPIRSGGSVILSADSTTGMRVDVSKKGGGGSGDIAVLRSSASGFIPTPTDNGVLTGLPGVPIVDPASLEQKERFNPTRLPQLVLGDGVTFDFVFTGGTVNVFEITDRIANNDNFPVRDTSSTLQLSRVINFTDGELVNVRAQSIGTLSAQWLGVSRPVSGVKIEGLEDAADSRGAVGNVYPFNQAKNMIFVTDAINIVSRGPIGNVVAFGTVQNVQANSDNKNVKGDFEGIVGPIVAYNTADPEGSVIRSVDIGEGLAYSGSGDVGFAGIYVEDKLGLVTNRNGGGDIRGDIIGGDYMEGIRLDGGSIIDADIVATAFNQLASPPPGYFTAGLETVVYSTFQGLNGENDSILNGMGDITVNGNGGIMNALIASGGNMGKIAVPNGFGIFTSSIYNDSNNNQGGMTAGGLGIRGVTYSGGSFTSDIVATGTGKLRSVSEFARSARASEFQYFDGAAGYAPTAATDLNLYLGTTEDKSKIRGTTEDGVIQDTTINASRSINSVKAYEFRAVNNPSGFRPRDETFINSISAGDSIGTISAIRNINGLRVVGGTVGSITAGRDITQFQLQGNERVKSVKAGRHFLGSASINLGNNGSLDLLQTGGNLTGTAYVKKGIKSIIVGGNLGTAASQGGIRSGTDINLLRVAGDISGTGYVRADRTIRVIELGGDVQEDATIRAKSITKQTIKGTIFGDIVVG